jgi:hypothetical protein
VSAAITPELKELRDEYRALQLKLDESYVTAYHETAEFFREARRLLSGTDFRTYVRDLGWKPKDAYALMHGTITVSNWITASRIYAERRMKFLKTVTP